jgi:hypothetical protein
MLMESTENCLDRVSETERFMGAVSRENFSWCRPRTFCVGPRNTVAWCRISEFEWWIQKKDERTRMTVRSGCHPGALEAARLQRCNQSRLNVASGDHQSNQKKRPYQQLFCRCTSYSALGIQAHFAAAHQRRSSQKEFSSHDDPHKKKSFPSSHCGFSFFSLWILGRSVKLHRMPQRGQPPLKSADPVKECTMFFVKKITMAAPRKITTHEYME